MFRSLKQARRIPRIGRKPCAEVVSSRAHEPGRSRAAPSRRSAVARAGLLLQPARSHHAGRRWGGFEHPLPRFRSSSRSSARHSSAGRCRSRGGIGAGRSRARRSISAVLFVCRSQAATTALEPEALSARTVKAETRGPVEGEVGRENMGTRLSSQYFAPSARYWLDPAPCTPPPLSLGLLLRRRHDGLLPYSVRSSWCTALDVSSGVRPVAPCSAAECGSTTCGERPEREKHPVRADRRRSGRNLVSAPFTGELVPKPKPMPGAGTSSRLGFPSRRVGRESLRIIVTTRAPLVGRNRPIESRGLQEVEVALGTRGLRRAGGKIAKRRARAVLRLDTPKFLGARTPRFQQCPRQQAVASARCGGRASASSRRSRTPW